jgi:hypothetical protein
MRIDSVILTLLVIALMLAAGCAGNVPVENTTQNLTPTSGILPMMVARDGGGAFETIHKAEPAPPTTQITTVVTTKAPVDYGTPVVQTTTTPFAFLTPVVTAVGMNPVTLVGCTPGSSPCNSLCVNLTTDSRNCGNCGNVCPGSLPVCKSGKCSTV